VGALPHLGQTHTNALSCAKTASTTPFLHLKHFLRRLSSGH
jgi:hypothetical protein